MKCDKCGYDWGDSGDSAHACAFYQTLKPSTHSPQRTWVGLTDEEIEAAIPFKDLSGEYYYDDVLNIILFIQAKLKEKNAEKN